MGRVARKTGRGLKPGRGSRRFGRSRVAKMPKGYSGSKFRWLTAPGDSYSHSPSEHEKKQQNRRPSHSPLSPHPVEVEKSGTTSQICQGCGESLCLRLGCKPADWEHTARRNRLRKTSGDRKRQGWQFWTPKGNRLLAYECVCP